MSAKPGDRKLHAALVAALATLVFALAPGVATADTFLDDTIADFPSGASTWAVEPGLVQRRPAMMSENFDGPGLPASLAATLPEAATVAAGALTVNAGRVNTPGFSSASQTLEFRAVFAGDERQHIGFGDTLNQAPWAIFSTGGPDDLVPLRARTQVDAATGAFTPLTGVDPTVPHTYRIEWGLTSVSYFVDGDLAVTHNLEITEAMRPIVSDGPDAGVVTVDWLAQGSVTAPAVFESRVHDTSDDRVIWDAVTTTPGDVAIATRTGDVPTPDGTWSAWEATGAAGTIVSPRGRYIQYRATLTNDDPVLDRVEITYEIDDDPPTVVIGGVQVTGDDASVTFSSPDADVDGFECALGAGAFAPCTSPKVFDDLPTGSYTVHVRALDEVGNIGSDSEDFAIDVTAPTAVIDGVQTSGDKATVTFGSPDADVDGYECALGAGAFAPCMSPQVFDGLANGSYTVYVRAIDESGNVGDFVSRDFVVDATAPTVAISAAHVAGSQVTVHFGSPDADVVAFECGLDGGAFSTCASPAVFSGIAPGVHTVRVRARDVAGNIGASDARGFTIEPPPPIDVTAPTAVIGGVQASGDKATVTFDSPDADVDDYECRLGAGGPTMTCTSPQVFDGLANGPYTVYVRAIDESGNVGDFVSRDFVVDATAPTVAISAAHVAGSQVTVHFGSPDADVQGFECSLDGGAFSACTSGAVFMGLAPGLHTLRVRARDVAGNVGPTDVRGFGIDDSPPSANVQDTTAPVVQLLNRRVRASKRGSVSVQVGCPAGETRCRLTLRAGSGPRKSATVAGGKTARVPVKLTAATRRKLAARGRLSVKIQVVASDDAGNRRTKEYRFTLLAPR